MLIPFRNYVFLTNVLIQYSTSVPPLSLNGVSSPMISQTQLTKASRFAKLATLITYYTHLTTKKGERN